MKAKDKYINYVVFFLIGMMVSYLSTEFRYFRINTELNVIETLIAILTLVIGYYIASSLQKKYNQNQNLYNYLVNRLDSLWNDFNSFNNQVEASDMIELTRVTKFVRNFQRENGEFKKLLSQLESVPNELETLSEQYLQLFEKSLIKNNISYYYDSKANITEIGNKITANFIAIFTNINAYA